MANIDDEIHFTSLKANVMGDIQLWERFKSGDKEALSQIFHDHIKILYKYGHKFSRDQQLVEDCIQDLFLEIWQRRENLGSTDSIKRYLLGSLRRKIIRKDQRVKKHLSDKVEMDEYNFEVEFTCEKLLIDQEISAENKAKINRGLSQLSKRQKEAIYLKYYADLDYQEVSEIMSLNYQSTRNIIHSSLKKLRQLLVKMIVFFLLSGWH